MSRKITGIYCIKNLINNKTYIGCAVDINRRWKEHRSDLKNNKHYNTYLQNSWNKYGKDNFEFEILEECTKDNIEEREKFYIKELNTKAPIGYNLTFGGEGLLGFHHTEESRKKMSIASKGKPKSLEARKNMSLADKGRQNNKGNHHTEEVKKKISDTKKQQVDQEFCEKMSKINRGKKRKGTSSKYVGVSYDKINKKWKASITIDGKNKYLGRHVSEIEAAKAYNEFALNYFGEKAVINIIEGDD